MGEVQLVVIGTRFRVEWWSMIHMDSVSSRDGRETVCHDRTDDVRLAEFIWIDAVWHPYKECRFLPS